MSKLPKQKPRERVVPAFGNALEKARGKMSMGQVYTYAGISQSTLSHWEKGTVAAPDPVILLKLARLYGVSMTDLVDVLEWSRKNPRAEEAPTVVSEVGEMRVTGAEENLMRRFRKMPSKQMSLVLDYMDFVEARAGGAADAGAPMFRKRKREG